jgi:Transglycosylase SLT domain
VPNFFIDSFQIPPFLLPIYQAAGVQYDVPWQVLAAINEIETDYGRNLSVSTAGAVGWMQFLPSTWKTWGVDANGDGVADPYNPVDAIFSAARYLHAAGASTSVPTAIFAYNHASWYVQSVLLRAKLIGGMPDALIGALSGLVQGHFPVAAPAKYADGGVPKLAKRRVRSGNAAIPVVSDPNAKSVSIFAKQNSPVIAVNDGKIVKVGHSQALGRYIELQDETGNIFTYAQLGSIPTKYPVPRPIKLTAADLAKELSIPTVRGPITPATAGSQGATGGHQPTPAVPAATLTNGSVGHATARRAAKSASSGSGPISLAVKPASTHTAPSAPAAPAVSGGAVKERLFAQPSRPGSFAAGGALQIQNSHSQISNFQNYFSDVLHLARDQYTLQPLKAGAIVVSGTILGRIAAGTPNMSSHLQFMIRPAGKTAPLIDPKPILDGWKLLEATAVYRAAGVDPFFGPGAKNPTVGQVLLMSKEQLTNRILSDPRAQIYACGRRDIQAGDIDRRILATIEFLTASGLDPTVTGLKCGHSLTGRTGTDAAGATGASVDISKINNIPVKGHQGPGSVTDIAIRRLLTLQGLMKPNQIISTLSYKGQSNTLALPDHANRIQITYTAAFGTNKRLSSEIRSILQPDQWIQLINRISAIPEPVVPIAPSQYAIRAAPVH